MTQARAPFADRPLADRIVRPALGTAAALSLLALAACGEGAVRISASGGDRETKGVLKVIDALQCPQTAGVLSRKGSAVAGGDTCVYAGPRGSEVVLSLIRLEGRDPHAVVADLEGRAARDLAHTLARMNWSETQGAGGAAPDGTASGASPGAPGRHALVEAPGVRVEARGDNTSVRLPGLRIETAGDQAVVHIGGVRIGSSRRETPAPEALPTDETVRIRAEEGAAEVRALAPGGAVRASYVLSDDIASPDGWRLVGFEARGPAGGPIVAAYVRSKEKREGDLFDAARSLVTLNVGD